MFKKINNINEHPLINKYTLINNNELYDCNICFNEYKKNYFKCNTCVFKFCDSCYKNYHLQYNSDKCCHCGI